MRTGTADDFLEDHIACTGSSFTRAWTTPDQLQLSLVLAKNWNPAFEHVRENLVYSPGSSKRDWVVTTKQLNHRTWSAQNGNVLYFAMFKSGGFNPRPTSRYVNISNCKCSASALISIPASTLMLSASTGALTSSLTRVLVTRSADTTSFTSSTTDINVVNQANQTGGLATQGKQGSAPPQHKLAHQQQLPRPLHIRGRLCKKSSIRSVLATVLSVFLGLWLSSQ